MEAGWVGQGIGNEISAGSRAKENKSEFRLIGLSTRGSAVAGGAFISSIFVGGAVLDIIFEIAGSGTSGRSCNYIRLLTVGVAGPVIAGAVRGRFAGAVLHADIVD